MPVDQGEPKLRFYGGKYEGHIVDAIFVLQITIGAMLAFLTLWFGYLTVGTVESANRPITHWFSMVPVLIGMAAAIILLNELYEYD